MMHFFDMLVLLILRGGRPAMNIVHPLMFCVMLNMQLGSTIKNIQNHDLMYVVVVALWCILMFLRSSCLHVPLPLTPIPLSPYPHLSLSTPIHVTSISDSKPWNVCSWQNGIRCTKGCCESVLVSFPSCLACYGGFQSYMCLFLFRKLFCDFVKRWSNLSTLYGQWTYLLKRAYLQFV